VSYTLSVLYTACLPNNLQRSRRQLVGGHRQAPPVSLQSLSERYRLAATAFAARRIDVSQRRECRAKISKGCNFSYWIGYLKNVVTRILRPSCTLCQTFKSITLVYTEEKRTRISVKKWSKTRKRKDRVSAVTTACLYAFIASTVIHHDTVT